MGAVDAAHTRLAAPVALTDYLWHWAQTSPEQPFLIDDGGAAYSYREAAHQVLALAAELTRRGVQRGERVALLAENSAAWVIGFLATMAAGAVSVPLKTRFTANELDAVLADANPAVVLVDDALSGIVSARWSACLLHLGEPCAGSPIQPAALAADAPACLTYSSGTTGRPKGILLSHGGITRSSETYAALFHSTPQTSTVVCVPLCHNTGFVDQLGHMLVAGGRLDVHRRFRPHEVADWLRSGRHSYFIGVPTMYHRMLAHLGEVVVDRELWLAFGGAPMPAALVTSLHRVFPNATLANCYGLSEATSITHVHFVRGEMPATVVGVAVAGTLDKISPSGELLVRSSTTMLGYTGEHDEAQRFEGGWLRTGDLAERDADGVVRVLGRMDEVINRGGEKVIPLEVEEALRLHPHVSDAAVVGAADPEYGQVVVAAVVAHSGLDPSELFGFLQTLIADYKRPDRIAVVEELPRNENGKVLKPAILELLLTSGVAVVTRR